MKFITRSQIRRYIKDGGDPPGNLQLLQHDWRNIEQLGKWVAIRTIDKNHLSELVRHEISSNDAVLVEVEVSEDDFFYSDYYICVGGRAPNRARRRLRQLVERMNAAVYLEFHKKWMHQEEKRRVKKKHITDIANLKNVALDLRRLAKNEADERVACLVLTAAEALEEIYTPERKAMEIIKTSL